MKPTSLKISRVTLLSLTIVVLSTFAAIFSYYIIPDNSPNANLQIPQIALQKPNHFQQFYRKKILEPGKQSVFHTLQLGKVNPYKYYPFDRIEYDKEEVVLKYGQSVQIFSVNQDDGVVEKRFILGTDKYGRDVLSRLVLGLRVSLFVGLFAVLLSLVIGLFFGVMSGYFGGWVDRLIMMIINVNWSIPTLLLAFAILLVMERGLTAIYLAIGFTLWVELARIVRGQVMELRNKEFILAAQMMGMSPIRIMWRHIIPNLYGTILVIASINFATAILVEAGLSYLGLGVQPPIPSLGNMLKENYGYATSGYLSLSIAPAVTILILVLSFNLLGNGLKDYFEK